MALILIRADASPSKGTGHVMRCLALAEALRDQGDRVIFVAAEMTAALVDRLSDAGFPLHLVTGNDPADILALADGLAADALVVDSYWLDAAWRAAVRPGFRTVLALDDLADRALHADLVWNPSPLAATLPYAQMAAGAEWLFGDRYLLLRREIAQAAAAPRRPLADRTSLLLTFGGSDPAGLTVPVLRHLAPALPPGIWLDVVAGGSNPALPDIRAAAAAFPDRVHLHVDSRQMGALMADCGLALTAGGGTVAELAALAVPCLLVVVADNQAPTADDARARGWAAVIDARNGPVADQIAARALSLWADLPTRTRLAQHIGAGTIDGQGAARVATALRHHLTGPNPSARGADHRAG